MSEQAIYQNRENELDYANPSYIPIEFREEVPRDSPDNDIQLDDEDLENLVRLQGVRPEVIRAEQNKKLKVLSKDANETEKKNTENNSISNLSLSEISEGVALVVINIMNDLLQGKPFIETLTKNNRLIFLGIFIVIFVLLITIVRYNEYGDAIVTTPTLSSMNNLSEISKLNTNLENILKRNNVD